MDVIRDDRHHRTGLVVVEEVCLALQRDTALGKGWIGTDTITFFHTEKHARELFIAAARFKIGWKTVPVRDDENPIAVGKFLEGYKLSRNPPILSDINGGCGFLWRVFCT